MDEKNNRELHIGLMQNNLTNPVSNSLAHLFHWTSNHPPQNNNALSFFGDDVGFASVPDQVQSFYIKFFGEDPSIMDREAWADPLRAEILKRLSVEGRSWYIGTYGFETKEYIQKQTNIPLASQNLFLSKFNPDNIIVIPTNPPFGMGKEIIQKVFIEVTLQDIDWAIENIWPDAFCNFPIEGYNLPSGMINELFNWSERHKDIALFNEVLQKSDSIFYTFPSEHRHFCFISNKYTLTSFIDRLKIDEMINETERVYLFE